MHCWKGRPPESWPVVVIFTLGPLWWAWGVTFGSVLRSNTEWAIVVVWVLREGVVPPLMSYLAFGF